MDCAIDNDYISVQVSNDKCLKGCEYTCHSGYEKTGSDSDLVFCHEFPRKWYIFGTLTPPCRKVLDTRESPGEIARTAVPITILALLGLFILWLRCIYCVRRPQAQSRINVLVSPAGRRARMQRERERRWRENEENPRRINPVVARGISETNTDREIDNQGFIIFWIRRFFTVNPNPYGAFRNPTEPPPYDAESAAPPAYEETGGVIHVTPDTPSDTAGTKAGPKNESSSPNYENIV